jgi:hypothetical protein
MKNSISSSRETTMSSGRMLAWACVVTAAAYLTAALGGTTAASAFLGLHGGLGA